MRICYRLLAAVLIIIFMLIPGTVNASGDYSYEYRFAYGSWVKKQTSWKDAGGQVSGGYRFSTGKGGFYWSEEGGPVSKLSFSTSIGFSSFAICVNMGKKTSNGEYVGIPGKPSYVKKHYYKLKVRKKIKARPFKMYRRLKHKNGKWKLASQGAVYKVLSYDLGVRKIK